jgi:catechol 2,3-dioxygenase-like lactoylglutathione lyase family enzyme
MTIKRLDHVSVVVDDLAAAIAFFTALGALVSSFIIQMASPSLWAVAEASR